MSDKFSVKAIRGCVSAAVCASAVALGVLSARADWTVASLYDLRVNGMAAPANVGPRPSFSWNTQGGAADRRQTAAASGAFTTGFFSVSDFRATFTPAAGKTGKEAFW